MTEIEIKDLTFGYNPDRPVISGINLKIDKPGLYCIIGPNGVGKSTLIKCINKILKPNSGCVLLDGVDTATMSNKEISKVIGYVPVAGADMFSMPVIDAILIGRYTQQKWKTTDEDLAAVKRTMKLLGITSLAMHGFNELSAGQHQKVAIARGLVQDAPVLLLDEPTANLDVRYQVYIAEMLKGLTRMTGITAIMISHDLHIASRFADQIILMEPPGKVRSIGTPKEVITKKNVEEVYGVSCEVLEGHDGSPHIELGSALWIDD